LPPVDIFQSHCLDEVSPTRKKFEAIGTLFLCCQEVHGSSKHITAHTNGFLIHTPWMIWSSFMSAIHTDSQHALSADTTINSGFAPGLAVAAT
jgi:hypothetical protein